MQAQEFMGKVDFVMTTPASGGRNLPGMKSHKVETDWLASAVEKAMAHQEALRCAIGDGNTSPHISVLNVVQLQTRGALKTKHFMQSKTICSLACCRGLSSPCTH